VNPNIDGPCLVEHRAEAKSQHADRDLQDRIDLQCVFSAINDTAAEEAAQRQSAHKHCEHGADSMDRIPQNHGQLSRPDDLIDQAANARAEKEREKRFPNASHERGALNG